MANVLEWVQCSGCGRRHRWKAELVGKAIDCACGKAVPVPAPAATPGDSGGFDPDDTLVDPSLSNEHAAISEAPPKLGDDMELEEDAKARTASGTAAGRKAVKAAKGQKAGSGQRVAMYGGTPIVVKKAGLFGMSRQSEMIVFAGLTALAFIMVVHALIVQTRWYIALSVLLVPIALWKFVPSYRRWLGNRSFKRAWAESFSTHDEPGDLGGSGGGSGG